MRIGHAYRINQGLFVTKGLYRLKTGRLDGRQEACKNTHGSTEGNSYGLGFPGDDRGVSRRRDKGQQIHD